MILAIGIVTSSAHGQVDALSDINFFQTGIISTDENKFSISNDISIREFFNGEIIRVSGHTIEGFPYITYSKIIEEKIETRGIIFIGGEFLELLFKEELPEESAVKKNNNLQILVQYTQRVYSEKPAHLDVKVYDPTKNKLNDFNQNYGFLTNKNINVTVLDENKDVFYSDEGVTNEKGLFEIEFFIPERHPRETLTVTIIAEDEHSKSSKILQIFTLGTIPDNDSSS
ncbi:hypothetical protein NKOR_04560 [Candidatus Nitrosopumilus koreensis AR1]|uniref:Uncharacterized protein n=1 Tax=Candidatus Nitrosopumilus koreensis AR1 TaxID=1229908 RepID=K0B738_9ARCH|nr:MULTISPECIES: hypothetical protein [Nitrosopumilus]AFS80800.1 hypothetical protein NKOR_04560 [Candidatus Nitrosopumilus koreensis AR1]